MNPKAKFRFDCTHGSYLLPFEDLVLASHYFSSQCRSNSLEYRCHLKSAPGFECYLPIFF